MKNKNRILQGAIIGSLILILGIYGWKESEKSLEEVQNTIVENHVSENDLNEQIKMIEEVLGEVPIEEAEEEDEYYHLAFANVNSYVNVRSEPSTDGAIVGKIFDGSVAEIVSEVGKKSEWYEIVSGNVTGYIKAEFFLRGKEAADIMDKYIVLYGNVTVDRLNIRKQPNKESTKLGTLENGDKVRILETEEEWLKVQYGDTLEGYVAAEYVTIQEEFSYAKTLEELEEIKRKEQKAILESQKEEVVVDPEAESQEMVYVETAVDQTQESETVPTPEQVPAPSGQGELRQQIINYAMQYVGNKYVSGGSSLASGTDCSGFTCFVYADFGYSISRTPQGQFTGSGRSIDYSAIQPGDIICYSSNGGKSCTHVAIYIGDGQIVHSANSRKGVITQNADYDRIIGVKNIID